MESRLDKGLAEIRLLEADPDLAAGLSPEQSILATERVRVPVEAVDSESLNDPDDRWDGAIGMLLLDGMVTRTLGVGDRSSTELLGAGDVLRPWQRDDEGLLPYRVEWRVLQPTRAALLDSRFASAVAPWPQVWSALLGRMMRRSRSQAVAMTLSHMNRVDQRLLLVFSHFAERWGRVRPDGIVVRLPVTHETIGALVGARRPSVTSALGQLARERLLVPGEVRGEWVLTEAGQERIANAQEPPEDYAA